MTKAKFHYSSWPKTTCKPAQLFGVEAGRSEAGFWPAISILTWRDRSTWFSTKKKLWAGFRRERPMELRNDMTWLNQRTCLGWISLLIYLNVKKSSLNRFVGLGRSCF